RRRMNGRMRRRSRLAERDLARRRHIAAGPGEVALSSQQRTRVASAIRSAHIRPIGRVNFSVNVGTRVPSSVQLEALPSTVVDVLPQYRGYRYFATED